MIFLGKLGHLLHFKSYVVIVTISNFAFALSRLLHQNEEKITNLCHLQYKIRALKVSSIS